MAAVAANFALAAEAASLALADFRPFQSLLFRLPFLVFLLPLGCKETARLSSLCSRLLLPSAAFQALTLSALEVERRADLPLESFAALTAQHSQLSIDVG